METLLEVTQVHSSAALYQLEQEGNTTMAIHHLKAIDIFRFRGYDVYKEFCEERNIYYLTNK